MPTVYYSGRDVSRLVMIALTHHGYGVLKFAPVEFRQSLEYPRLGLAEVM